MIIYFLIGFILGFMIIDMHHKIRKIYININEIKNNKLSITYNSRNAIIAQVASDLDTAVRMSKIGGVPSSEQLSKWAEQLRVGGLGD